MIVTFSKINVRNCTFNDILSYNDGGAFNFNSNYYVEGSYLNFNNVTSLGLVLINILNYIKLYIYDIFFDFYFNININIYVYI